MSRFNGHKILSTAPKQRSAQARETEHLYQAILGLRRAGHVVYRIGQGVHFFNGSLRTSDELLEIAGSLS